MLVLFPLGLAIGVIAMAYAHVTGALRRLLGRAGHGLHRAVVGGRRAPDFDGGVFQGWSPWTARPPAPVAGSPQSYGSRLANQRQLERRRPMPNGGLHYLLIHYDIPAVDPATLGAGDRRRRGAGARASPQPSSPGARRQADSLRGAPGMRGLCSSRVRWAEESLTERVGTGEWGGAPLTPQLLEEGA